MRYFDDNEISRVRVPYNKYDSFRNDNLITVELPNSIRSKYDRFPDDVKKEIDEGLDKIKRKYLYEINTESTRQSLKNEVRFFLETFRCYGN